MDRALLILTAYLPFQLAINPIAGIDLASVRLFILGLFFLWLAKGMKNKKINLIKNGPTLFLISFLFLCLLSILVAENSVWAARKAIFLLSIFPLYFVVATIVDSREKVEKMTATLVFSGSLAALLGIVQFCGQFFFGLEKTYSFWAKYIAVPFLGKSFSVAVLQNPSWLVNVAGKTYLRATSIFPDPHMLSFYLGMLIPLAASLRLVKKEKTLYSASLVVLILADLLTFSRGGYLGLAIGGMFFLLFLKKQTKKKFTILAFAVTTTIVFILAVPNPFSQRFYSSFNLKEGSNQGRLETWRQAVEVIKKNPALGVGLGNYPLEIKPTAGYREPIYAHSTYLDITAESGVFSLLSWLGFLLSSFWIFFKKKQENPLFLASGASLLIFGAHSLVETGIYSVTVLPLLLIIVGLSGALSKKNEAIFHA